MAAVRMIYEAHEGSIDGRDPGFMHYYANVLGRTGIYNTGKSINFHKTDSPLSQVFELLILCCVMAKLEVCEIKRLPSKLLEVNWVGVINDIVSK